MFDKGLITESRLASAKKKELTPVEMSKEDEKGIFVGSEGNLYTTTLDNCSCPDFAIQGYLQPCKHMIRLAMEFGEIPDDGKASDPDAAKARYYLGKAKKFIHEAPLTQVIDFSIAYAHALAGEPGLKDDAFMDSMTLAKLSDSPLFSVKKNGAVKIEKAWKKDWDNLLNLLRNRFGAEVLQRIGDKNFIEVFCKGE